MVFTSLLFTLISVCQFIVILIFLFITFRKKDYNRKRYLRFLMTKINQDINKIIEIFFNILKY